MPAGYGQVGIDSFLSGYVDSLLTYGRAVGEIVLSGNRVADPAGMSPDLILSACFKIEFYACIVMAVLAEMFQCAAMTGCEFPLLSWRSVPVIILA